MRLEEIDRATQERIVARLEAAIPGAKALPFLCAVATARPDVCHMQELTGRHPSTWASRFQRAGVPSAKYYLAHMRLIRAHAMLASSLLVTLSDVTTALHFSTTQAFCRHVYTYLGVAPTAWRLHITPDFMLDGFIQRAVLPYAATLAWFDPDADPRAHRMMVLAHAGRPRQPMARVA